MSNLSDFYKKVLGVAWYELTASLGVDVAIPATIGVVPFNSEVEDSIGIANVAGQFEVPPGFYAIFITCCTSNTGLNSYFQIYDVNGAATLYDGVRVNSNSRGMWSDILYLDFSVIMDIELRYHGADGTGNFGYAHNLTEAGNELFAQIIFLKLR